MLSGKTGAQPLQHLRVQSGRTWERARQADNFLPLEYGERVTNRFAADDRGNDNGVSGVDVLRPGHRSFAAAQDDNVGENKMLSAKFKIVILNDVREKLHLCPQQRVRVVE
ncbi:MAG: hypothetical protein H0X47_16310 [Nitrospirales bacterium]|nr:hypothetical protein [Nitrospirales bacterium]